VSLLLSTAALAALAQATPIDTTLPVERGQRLTVEVYGGDITVKTWNRNAVRIQADPSGRTRVEISSSPSGVEVHTEGRRGPPSSVDVQVTAPTWMALDLSGVYTDVSVDGTKGPINVETVQGEVKVNGGDGLLSLRSVQGGVTLRNAKGRIAVNSVNESVSVSDASGEVAAETVNGDVQLDRVDASSVEASTVNGDLGYSGPIRNGGRYSFSSHNGDITLAVAQGTSAAVSVSTFSGEFESDFPVTLSETKKGKRFSFTLGGGSAQVTLESFQGTVRLVRPGHTPATRPGHRDGDDHDDHDDH
jgi:DUF4097 and DUF4098 domain-containing protein YvlB